MRSDTRYANMCVYNCVFTMLPCCCHDRLSRLSEENAVPRERIPDMTVPGRSTILATGMAVALAGLCYWQGMGGATPICMWLG